MQRKNKPITEKGFDRFWKHYPKKADKGKTLTKWKKLCRTKNKPGIITILWAIERQKHTDRWKRGYIPNPTTWLNQQRWLDDPAQMRDWKMTEPLQIKQGFSNKGDKKQIENIKSV